MTRFGTGGKQTARPRLEVLEDRLALTWGAVPPTTITPPFSPAVVTLDNTGDAAGDAWINSEVDYYRFTAPVAGTYRFTTATPVGPLDTVVGVFNSGGQRLAHNNNAPGTTDSDVTFTLAAGHTCFVGVTNLEGTPGGGYKWKVHGTFLDDPYENNDTRETAANLGTMPDHFTATGLVMADAADWYKFTTAAAGTSDHDVRIWFEGQGDLDLRLYDASGRQVGESLGDHHVESISLQGLAAGTYYVQVDGWQPSNPIHGTLYTLRFIAPRLVDDHYENNDVRQWAHDFGSLSWPFVAANLVLADAADWYKFTMAGAGTSNDFVGISFTHAQGDLDLRLYDASGRQVGESLGGSDGERISLQGLAAGAYYVQVYGWQSFNPSYSLEISPVHADDSYEDNDTRQTASNLGQLTSRFVAANLMMGDAADWFRFTTWGPGTASDHVRIMFTHAQGDLDLRLYDASGKMLRGSLGLSGSEMVSLQGLPTGTYYAQVYGKQGATNPNYTLEILPPVVADDPYEENDSRPTAADLGTVGPVGEYDLKLNDSADWFRFAMVGPATGPFGVQVRHAGPGLLRVRLYDGSGKFLRDGTGVPGAVDVSLFGLGAGTYFLEVRESAGKFVPAYHLAIWGGQPDDEFEDNDVMSQAASDGGSGGEGGMWSPDFALVLADVDWYRIYVQPYWNPHPSFRPGGVIYVESQYGADMDVELYDSQGRLVTTSGGGSISFSDLEGEYFLKFTPRRAYVRYSFGVNSNSWDDAL